VTKLRYVRLQLAILAYPSVALVVKTGRINFDPRSECVETSQ